MSGVVKDHVCFLRVEVGKNHAEVAVGAKELHPPPFMDIRFTRLNERGPLKVFLSLL